MYNEKEQAMGNYLAKESLLKECKQYFLMGSGAYYLVSHLYHSFLHAPSSIASMLRSGYLTSPFLRIRHP
jgi:hypothetical protein